MSHGRSCKCGHAGNRNRLQTMCLLTQANKGGKSHVPNAATWKKGGREFRQTARPRNVTVSPLQMNGVFWPRQVTQRRCREERGPHCGETFAGLQATSHVVVTSQLKARPYRLSKQSVWWGKVVTVSWRVNDEF